MIRSLEKECRRSTELQELLSAAERRGDELSSTTHDQSVVELKTQLNEQLRKTSELRAVLDDETHKLSADKVTPSKLWTFLFTTNSSRNKRNKQNYRQQTNKQWCDLINLTKVYNSMTMTTKEKRLANIDIEISQHALVTFKFLTEFVVFYL